MKHVIRWLLLAWTLSALPVLAQDGTINFDTSVSGEITDEDASHRYTFEGEAGVTILARMTSPKNVDMRLDPYLILEGPDGEQLYFDDDSGGNLDAALGPYQLPQDGTYTLIATRCCTPNQPQGSTGAYELTLTTADVVPLVLGEAITVTLDPQNPAAFFDFTPTTFAYRIQANRVDASTGNFSLDVRGPEGQYVSGGGGFEGSDARLEPLLLSGTERYQITLRLQPMYDPMQQQDVMLEEPITLDVVLAALETQPLAIGETVEGTVSDENRFDYYTFEATTSQLLRLTGPEADPAYNVQVFGPQGFATSGGSSNMGPDFDGMVVDPVQIQTGGTHLIQVNRITEFGPMGPAAADPVAYALTLAESEVEMLVPGEEVTGTVEGGIMPPSYRFEGRAGQPLRVTLRSLSDSYGPGINIQAPTDGDSPPNVISGNSGLPATLTFTVDTLPADGTYLVQVFNNLFIANGPAPSGDFGLMIEILE